MIPAGYDFSIVRGTTQPFAVKITIEDPANPPARIPIPHTAFIFSLKIGSAAPIHKSTAVGGSGFVYDGATNVATWTPTAAESRSLKTTPEGGAIPNSYELEVRNGATQMVYLAGKITALGGLNDD